jgi:hypothetical protein
MVEATNSSSLHPTSISYVYTVFLHLDMLWMDIFVHPYTVIPMQVGLNVWKVGVWVRPNAVVVSWLRLQTASEGIPHPYHMYAPLHCYTCVGGGEFFESWGVGESKWYCGFMVEATTSFRLYPISISYVYIVFQHLDMLQMDIWVHPYNVILV